MGSALLARWLMLLKYGILLILGDLSAEGLRVSARTVPVDRNAGSVPNVRNGGSSVVPIDPHTLRFTKKTYDVTIPENCVSKTYARVEEKMGIECGGDFDIRYKIVSGNHDKFFKADERKVGNFCFLLIRTRTQTVDVLNRERRDQYRLIIKASVSRKNSKHVIAETETAVLVNILDTNDISPLFERKEYETEVPEDTPLYTNITQLIADDADLGVNGEIYYSFQTETDIFAINPSNGIISLTRKLNHTETDTHELIAVAKDRGPTFKGSSKPTTAKVRIRVRPVNLFSPVIYAHHLTEIVEQSNGDIYAIVRVTDQDAGIHGQLDKVEIVRGNFEGNFELKPSVAAGKKKRNEFDIVVSRLLDREKAPKGFNLTLRAVDKGVPPRESFKNVLVSLSDTNDNSPIFEKEIYDVSVSENAPINFPIARLKVNDFDQGKNAQIVLEIVGGNEGREFSINSNTGALYTNAILDAEAKSFYSLTVSALDQGNIGNRKQTAAKIKINVIDANDNDPIFDQPPNLEIVLNENEPAGTTVTRVSAKDKDAGENAYVSYSISNLNSVPFEIDYFSGLIRTTEVIDFETMRREYTLAVRASDWGLPFRRQSEMKVVVKIQDVNDNRPIFEKVDCTVRVDKNVVRKGKELIALSAIDYDGQVVTYRLLSGNEDNCFSLDASTGIISAHCDFKYIQPDPRELNVTATDSKHYSDISRIRIEFSDNPYETDQSGVSVFGCKETEAARKFMEISTLAEKNNNRDNKEDFAVVPPRYGENLNTPEFINFPAFIPVNESVSIGTILITIKAYDRDKGYNGKLIYGIVDGDEDSVFKMDPDLGEIKLVGFLDAEKRKGYTLNITVYDLGKPQKFVSRTLTILVLDVNDNYPKFVQNSVILTLQENTLNGTIVCKFEATDPDEGNNGRITYSLVTEFEEFSINPENGEIYVSSTVDREKVDYYDLIIRATDGGVENPLHSDAFLKITILDANDNPPKFPMDSYSVQIREDIPVGSVVAIVSATDQDLDLGGEIRYSMRAESDDEENVFSIDKLTGTVRLAKALDFEDRQVHSATVEGRDRGDPSLSSSVTITVNVIDVNENLHAPVFSDFVVTCTVAEDQPIGTIVTRIKATDEDVGDDARVGYTIREGDGLGYFSIDHEGNIRTTANLDAETKSFYWLTVYAQDHGIVPLHNILQVLVEVTDVKDELPLTSRAVYQAAVVEGPGANPYQRVIQVTADTNDQAIRYAITSGNAEGCFMIDPITGWVTTTNNKMDRETIPEYNLEIKVTNGDLSSTSRLIVTVLDINDNSPVFSEKYYTFTIPETDLDASNNYQNSSVDNEITSDLSAQNTIWESFDSSNITGDALFRVVAADADIGENASLHYSLSSQSMKDTFCIHPNTGIVFSERSFTAGEQFSFLVKATDGGTPSSSSVVRVRLAVTAVKEYSPNSPIVKQPDRADISENDPVGFLVANIQATDQDGDYLWYDIEDGDPRSEFLIREGGNVLIAKKLNWDIQNRYNLTISVSDGTNTATTQLFIYVADVNEKYPSFVKDVFYVNISESLPAKSEVLKLDVHPTKHSQLYYTIHNSKHSISLKSFALDVRTGIISILEPVDRETISKHTLTVTVTDNGIPSKRNYARVVITVHDSNDHAPEFSVGILQGRVLETAAVGTQVVQLFATDKDHGENAQITYSIVSGNVGGVFSIDDKTGVIQVAKELDVNSRHFEYLLNVKAIDGGKPALSSAMTVHVMVVTADNSPPEFTKAEVYSEMYENEPVGSVVKYLEAVSTSSVLYEITGGDDAASFEINPSTGVLITARKLDYEVIKSYNLTITATNMASSKATCNVIVHVLDRNDNFPEFSAIDYVGYIGESSITGSIVLTADNDPLVLNATDADSELNAALLFEIVDAEAKKMFNIIPHTGALKTATNIDYETTSRITFKVRVTDTGRPRLTCETMATVNVFVNDVNDNPPLFSQREYNATVILPTYANIAIIQVNATDRDSKNITSLKYAIVSGNERKMYAISPETGLIILLDPNVANGSNLQRLLVTVSDGHFTSEAVVNINWETNEESGLVFQRSSYQGVVQENKTKVMTVAVVNVLGSALNENLVFSILNPTPYFTIGRTSGAIRTTGVPFDREAQEYHRLIVQASSEEEEGSISRVAHVSVNVTVLDENDNCPMFVNLPYYAVVSIDARKGDVITKVHAVDLDKGENGEIVYELRKGNGELFKINRKNGEISLKKSLQGFNKEYVLLIAAMDGGVTSCSADVTVNLKVIDRSMPVFDKQFYSVSVSEDVEINSPLQISVKAESPLLRKLIYSITAGNTLEQFAVDFNTGAINVIDELDYEKISEYALTIRATDSLSGIYAEVFVNVRVTDANDCAPEFEHDNYNVTISEAAVFGSLVAVVNAADNDSKNNKLIRYSIQSDEYNSTHYFHIDPDSGSIYLKRPLDHETRRNHHFIVEASNTVLPPLSSTVHVWLSVLDVNDNAPKFEQSTYVCYLSDEASRGQFVTVVSATDADSINENRLMYTIAEGNQMQIFNLDFNTGVITILNPQKLTDLSSHLLNISASDGIYTSFTRVRIEVLSANRHAPIFEKVLYEGSVSENQNPGGNVLRVKATDQDSGLYGQISYFVPSRKMGDIFHIDNTTGEIITKKTLDREEKSVYEFTVMAIDGGSRITYSVVRVLVTDVNDNAPQFFYNEYKTCIRGNLQVGSHFFKIKATDKDEDLASSIEYTIYEPESSEVKDLFQINKTSGNLILSLSAKSYENQVFQFFVRASDRGIPPLYADVPVVVYIMSSDDEPPVLDKSENKFIMSEKSSPGSYVTTLKLITNTSAQFKIATNKSPFAIDPSGVITLNEELDREANAFHVIGLLAYTDSSPPLTSFSEIVVQVLDANDNAPVFDSDVYYISLAEDTPEGTSILKVHAEDNDEGKNAEIRYIVEDAENSAFAVDAYSGWVVTRLPLDRESQELHKLRITAVDGGSPAYSAYAEVHIQLKDCNDNPTVFAQNEYRSSVKEDSLAGTVVSKLSISDADVEIPPNIALYLTSGNEYGQFAVRSTGEVYVSQPLDREHRDHYRITVVATDGLFIAETKLDITIIDANDERPYCLKYRYKYSLSEKTPIDTYVTHILAMDLDLEPKLRFYLTGAGAESFALDRNSGELKVSQTLDRETQVKYQLIAHVQDKDQVEWECKSLVDITVSDENDNAPQFASLNNTVSVLEDAEVGTLVTKMHATDLDVGMNRKIRYQLLHSANDHFLISADTGIVTLAKKLDREEREVFNLTVQVADQGSPQLFNSTSLLVYILDVNDNPPEFISSAYHASIPENIEVGTEVTEVTATSLDTGVNAQVIYSIVSGNEHAKFSIVPETGHIKIAQSLDYEKCRDYLLTIQATDLGSPPLSNQVTVNITVLDFNDNAPIFTQFSYVARVPEDIPVADVVLKVTANDYDSGSNGKITYTLVKGDKHQQFAIDPISGHITIARPLDRELIPSYTLHVTATDGGIPELSSVVLVNINVADVNDNPPLFSSQNISCVIQEGKKPGWPVCELNVTDADISPNGSPFVFDILSGNSHDIFRIDSDGTLRTTSHLRHKIRDTYTLRVRVFDNGTSPRYSDTWVTIKVIEESQFPPAIIPLEVWVGSYQDRWPGGQVGRIHASDHDQYDTLLYQVLHPHHGLFTVDERTGVLSATSGLDSGQYILNVSVCDGKFTSYSPVTVTVEPLFDDMLADAVSIRIRSMTTHQFILQHYKSLVRLLKKTLYRDVSIVSIQEATQGHIDVVFLVKGGTDAFSLHAALQAAGLSTITFPCSCLKNQGACKQRLTFQPEQPQLIATDMYSFIAPAHYQQIYCACFMGFNGSLCEKHVPVECLCPVGQQCVREGNNTYNFRCVGRPVMATACAENATCSSSLMHSLMSLTLQEILVVCGILLSAVIVFCFCVICCRKGYRRVPHDDKPIPSLNPDIKRTSKVNNTEVTRNGNIRPLSYTASGGSNDLYSAAAAQLNNLDTLRSYGSAGDELENVPADYVRNLNRTTNNATKSIKNNLKRTPEFRVPYKNSRNALSCVEDTKLLGGYHWDCSDWVRRSQNPLPNISEVAGSEVPDSSSFRSNDSDDENTRLNPINSSQDLDTMDEENMYISYRSEDEDDVIPYGFPVASSRHCKSQSQTDLSANICDIDDSDCAV